MNGFFKHAGSRPEVPNVDTVGWHLARSTKSSNGIASWLAIYFKAVSFYFSLQYPLPSTSVLGDEQMRFEKVITSWSRGPRVLPRGIQADYQSSVNPLLEISTAV